MVMQKLWWLVDRIGQVGLLTLLGLTGVRSAIAQVTADPSLGTRVTLNGSTFEITDGVTVGGRNLFHSFSRFDVPDGGAASFLNAPTIANIFARVTGGTASDIQGIIRAQGTANLFLMNPQGILFGSDAQLNLGGSFIATSASAIQFPVGGEFSQTSAVDVTNPLLSIDPSALFFNQLNPGRIENRSRAGGAGLRTPDRSLLLVGGEVVVDGGILFAPGGRIELAGLAAPGQVGLTTTGNLISLSVPLDAPRADISLSNRAILEATNNRNGGVSLTGRQINLSNGSVVSGLQGSGITVQGDQLILQGDSVLDTSTNTAAQAGAIQIQVEDTVSLAGSSVILSSSTETASGGAGEITLSARRLSLENSIIGVVTYGTGNAGKVTVRTIDSVYLANNSILANSSFGTGNGGELLIETGSLRLENDSGVFTSSQSSGNSGSITIWAWQRVEAIDTSLISTVNFSSGGSGDITLDTAQLSLQQGSFISASTANIGNGGNVVVRASESIDLAGYSLSNDENLVSSLNTNVGPGATGRGGNLTVETRRLNVREGGTISTNTFGTGNAGHLSIWATDAIEVSGRVFLPSKGLFAFSQLSTGSGYEGGDAGRLSIETGTLTVTDHGWISAGTASSGNGGEIDIRATRIGISSGAQINAVTSGAGNAGDITLRATQIDLDDGNIAAQANNSATSGRGGNILLDTRQLNLQNGAQISASTFGSGNAGNLSVRAADITLTGENAQGTFSGLFAGVDIGATGNGGDLRVDASRLRVLDGAVISTDTAGAGDAGNLTVHAGEIELAGTDRSGLSSGISAGVSVGATGRGGNLEVSTDRLTIRDGAGITVSSSGQGNAGDLFVTANQILLNDRAFISATTNSTEGGNITLNVRDLLLLRRNSEISTTAGRAGAGGNGGNITINAPRGFIVAIPQENSDITANAFTGRGGNVQITAEGILGLEFRPQLTPESDITASSTFGVSGVVSLTTPDNTVQNSLSQLSASLVDLDSLLTNSCLVRNRKTGGVFLITGNGGLPIRPGDPPLPYFPTGDVRGVEDTPPASPPVPFSRETLHEQPAAPRGVNGVEDSPVASSRSWQSGDRIVEAAGLYRLSDGRQILASECLRHL
jgi:filamentous hemagglutinin family protein